MRRRAVWGEPFHMFDNKEGDIVPGKLMGSLLAAMLVASAACAVADTKYPQRPVTLIVPFSAGGGTDATMRAFAVTFQTVTGQPMVIENKPGGGTLVALGSLKSKPADGYTLAAMSTSHFTAYWLNGGKGAVQPLNDFDYLAGTHGSVFALVARAESPFNTVADLVQFAKSHPDRQLSFGYFGATPGPAADFAQLAGIKATHIPFKGEAEAQAAVLGGHVDATLSSGTFIPYVTAGKMKVIALTGPTRLPDYPQWRTMREQGYEAVLFAQLGLVGPKGIDPEVAARIEAITRQVTQHPDFIAAAQRLYQPVQFMTRREYEKFAAEQMQVERAKVEKLAMPTN
jgi:tripartite-type tricarboxylate transporter receptor subunit TctC